MIPDFAEWEKRKFVTVWNSVIHLNEFACSLKDQVDAANRLAESVYCWYDVRPGDVVALDRLMPRLREDLSRFESFYELKREIGDAGDPVKLFESVLVSLLAREYSPHRVDGETVGPQDDFVACLQSAILGFFNSVIAIEERRIKEWAASVLTHFERILESLQRGDWPQTEALLEETNSLIPSAQGRRARPRSEPVPEVMSELIRQIDEKFFDRIVDPTDLFGQLMRQALGIDESRLQNTRHGYDFPEDAGSIRDLQFLIVRLACRYGSRTKTKNLTERIADALNVSKRTVERIAADTSRSFETIVEQRRDLARIAYEFYRTAIRPYRLRRKRKGSVPKNEEVSQDQAVPLLSQAIAEIAGVRSDDLTLEMTRLVLGPESPNAESLEELLETLANRYRNPGSEPVEDLQPVDRIGPETVGSTSIPEVDAELEAEALGLDSEETNQYLRRTGAGESLSDLPDRIERLTRQFFAVSPIAAKWLGQEIDTTKSIVDLWNRMDPLRRRGSVIEEFLSADRQLRIHLRMSKESRKRRRSKVKASSTKVNSKAHNLQVRRCGKGSQHEKKSSKRRRDDHHESGSE